MTSEWISPQIRKLLSNATPDKVRFIKLGRKSVWWPIAKQTNTIRLGFKTFDFRLCAAGEWDKARRKFSKTSSRHRTADVTRAVNQVREFFELPKSVLWITIEDGDLWWCFAETKVENIYHGDDNEEDKYGARLRRAVGE